MAFARSTVPSRVRAESASTSGPGKAPSVWSSASRRASCCRAYSSMASSLRCRCVAVTRSMRRRAVKARIGPEIVNARRATAMAVARFGPPPATAAQAPRHCGGLSVRKGGFTRMIMTVSLWTHAARKGLSLLLQEALEDTLRRDHRRFIGLILTGIAEHVLKYLGVEDASGRRHEGTEILLVVESITEADTLGGEMG